MASGGAAVGLVSAPHPHAGLVSLANILANILLTHSPGPGKICSCLIFACRALRYIYFLHICRNINGRYVFTVKSLTMTQHLEMTALQSSTDFDQCRLLQSLPVVKMIITVSC